MKLGVVGRSAQVKWIHIATPEVKYRWLQALRELGASASARSIEQAACLMDDQNRVYHPMVSNDGYRFYFIVETIGDVAVECLWQLGVGRRSTQKCIHTASPGEHFYNVLSSVIASLRPRRFKGHVGRQQVEKHRLARERRMARRLQDVQRKHLRDAPRHWSC